MIGVNSTKDKDLVWVVRWIIQKIKKMRLSRIFLLWQQIGRIASPSSKHLSIFILNVIAVNSLLKAFAS